MLTRIRNRMQGSRAWPCVWVILGSVPTMQCPVHVSDGAGRGCRKASARGVLKGGMLYLLIIV